MSTSNTSAPSPPNKGPSGSGVRAEGDRSRDDRPSDFSIVLTSGEENVVAKGRLLYPERGPSRFARRLAKAALDEARRAGPGRLLLVFSPALWYGVAELLAELPADGAVLCLETDPGLASLSLERMPEALREDPRVAFVTGGNPRAWTEAATRLGRFRRSQPVSLSGGADLDPAAYREAAFILDEEFSAYWRNRASLAAMGRLWVRNIFRNLARMDEISPRMPARISGAAVVCGAGPSLEAALPLIARHRDKLRVVAADTAAGPLAQYGIVPDLVVCLEAQIWNLRDFLPLEETSFALLADISSHPSTFRLPGAANSLSIVRIFEGALMARLRSLDLPFLDLPPLGSVGVHALHVAARLGAGPIFVAGLDFAFERGKTHARGSPALDSDLRSASRLAPPGSRTLAASFQKGVRPCPNDRGLTDPVLSHYAAQAAEEIGVSGVEVIDLRKGFGLPLGARALQPQGADRILDALPSQEPTDFSGSIAQSGRAKRGRNNGEAGLARDFLAAELTKLLELEGDLRGGELRNEAALLRSLAALDYLLWPMPDADRVASLPQDLLNRILVETEYWIAQLSELTAR